MDPRRTRILKDMGIDLWRRRGAVAGSAGSRPSQDGRHQERMNARGPDGALTVTRTPAGGARRAGAARASGAAWAEARTAAAPDGGPGPQPNATAAATDPAFTLWAVRTEGVLLVTGPFTSRSMAVLARDIVRSACRSWSAPAKQFRFDWPWPGATGSAAPALNAFLDKQAQDCAVQCALVTQSMAERTSSSGLAFIAIPDLEQLHSPEAKRELWRRLQAATGAAQSV